MVHIAPYFHETWWFYGLCVLTVALGGYGGYRYRVFALRRHQEQLEKKATDRTRELRQTNDQILPVNVWKKVAGEFFVSRLWKAYRQPCPTKPACRALSPSRIENCPCDTVEIRTGLEKHFVHSGRAGCFSLSFERARTIRSD